MRVARLLLPLCFVACAAEGGGEGGADNLPDRGIGGWELSGDAEDPFVLSAPGTALAAPSALVVGDRVRIYGHRPAGDGFELFVSEGDGANFEAPIDLGLGGHDPSVTRDAEGLTWLAWVDDDGAIALATAAAGRTFERREVSGIAGAREAPSVVIDGARVRLYLSTGTTIVHTEASRESLSFGAETEVLAPGRDCVANDGDPKPCWDEDAIVEVEVERARDATGATVFRMFYAGNSGGASQIGFAASFDGLDFSRYPFNPVIGGSFDQRSPTSVILGDTYMMFWSERRSTELAGIVRATHEADAPSERW